MSRSTIYIEERHIRTLTMETNLSKYSDMVLFTSNHINKPLYGGPKCSLIIPSVD